MTSNRQTIATEKYRKKMGIITKSFKMPKSLTDEFALACERAGITQNKAVSDFMKEFIAEHPGSEGMETTAVTTEEEDSDR